MIELQGVSHRYPHGRSDVLRGLTVTLTAGKIYGLLGKNGEGKTTLFKVLSGLLEAEGRVLINGFTPFKREAAFLADIFLLPEEFNLPRLKPMQYKALYAPFYPKFDDNLFLQLLKEFNIEEQKSLNQYSFGQRKKFMIAFALATQCKILLMDEPTNGLDIPSKAILRKVLVENMNSERLVMISTHQARDLEMIIENLVVINDGFLLFDGTQRQVEEKLSVIKTQTEPCEQALYSSQDAYGIANLVKRVDFPEGSKPDLELFFTALIEKPKGVLDGLKQEGVR